jgi:predicted HTH transcriptional regulator
VFGGKEAAAIHLNVFSDKMTIESPLPPSPLYSHIPDVIPNSSTQKNKFLSEILSVEE